MHTQPASQAVQAHAGRIRAASVRSQEAQQRLSETDTHLQTSGCGRPVVPLCSRVRARDATRPRATAHSAALCPVPPRCHHETPGPGEAPTPRARRSSLPIWAVGRPPAQGGGEGASKQGRLWSQVPRAVTGAPRVLAAPARLLTTGHCWCSLAAASRGSAKVGGRMEDGAQKQRQVRSDPNARAQRCGSCDPNERHAGTTLVGRVARPARLCSLASRMRQTHRDLLGQHSTATDRQ